MVWEMKLITPLCLTGTYQFFEGDIVLTNVTTAKMATPRSSARRKRAIIRPISKLWKYGIVPYVLDSSLSKWSS